MIGASPGRIRPQHRGETQSSKESTAQVTNFTAPTGGLFTRTGETVNKRGYAAVLENFFPTTRGVKPRGGSARVATITAAVESVIEYASGTYSETFIADANNLYRVDNGTPVAVVTGQTSGHYSSLLFQNDGGEFLTVVNGTDAAQQYDGTTWAALSLTGVDSALLSHVWAHQNRTFLVEKNTMNAWYLGVNSVAGAATRLPLSGVFNKGGALLFGATLSSDSGSGLDDRCVFVTTAGEVAIFAGTNPGSFDDWALNGVYDIGKPLGAHAHMSVAGDLIVATESGFIPLSAALSKDPSQLKITSLAAAIAPDWETRLQLSDGSDWLVAKWTRKNLAFIVPPTIGDAEAWVLNLETGAWATVTGWSMNAVAVVGQDLIFGDSVGGLFSGDTGGTDDGLPFECRVCLAFDDLESPAGYKLVHALRATWMYLTDFSVRHSMAFDYETNFPSAPGPVSAAVSDSATWDVSSWDTAEWTTDIAARRSRMRWQAVNGHGRAVGVQANLMSSEGYKLDCELVSVDLTYSMGSSL